MSLLLCRCLCLYWQQALGRQLNFLKRINKASLLFTGLINLYHRSAFFICLFKLLVFRKNALGGADRRRGLFGKRILYTCKVSCLKMPLIIMMQKCFWGYQSILVIITWGAARRNWKLFWVQNRFIMTHHMECF